VPRPNGQPVVYNINSTAAYSYFRLIVIEFPEYNEAVEILQWNLTGTFFLTVNKEAFTSMANPAMPIYYDIQKDDSMEFSTYSVAPSTNNVPIRDASSSSLYTKSKDMVTPSYSVQPAVEGMTGGKIPEPVFANSSRQSDAIRGGITALAMVFLIILWVNSGWKMPNMLYIQLVALFIIVVWATRFIPPIPSYMTIWENDTLNGLFGLILILCIVVAMLLAVSKEPFIMVLIFGILVCSIAFVFALNQKKHGKEGFSDTDAQKFVDFNRIQTDIAAKSVDLSNSVYSNIQLWNQLNDSPMYDFNGGTVLGRTVNTNNGVTTLSYKPPTLQDALVDDDKILSVEQNTVYILGTVTAATLFIIAIVASG
jgi:hypothetical protein